MTTLVGFRVESSSGGVATFEGGSASVHRSGPGASFSVDWRGRKFELEWEPRETGALLLVEERLWHEGPREWISDDDWEAVLDAIWALVPSSGGVKALLERREGTGAYVARRWVWPEDALRFCVQRERLDVLVLGATLRILAAPDIPYLRFRAELPRASWIEPSARPVTPAEWAWLVASLKAVTPDQFLLTFGTWSVEVSGAL